MYRYSGIFGEKFQREVAKIIKKHYNQILDNKA